MLMVGVLIAAMTTYIQPHALELGIPRIAGFFVAFSATVLGVRVLLGSWMDRLDRHTACTLSAAVYVAVLLATPGVTKARLPLLGAALGLAHGIFVPSFNAMNLQRAGEGERGKVMAVVSGSFNTGLAAGTYLLGWLAAAAGYAATFLAAAAGAALALLLLLLFRGSDRWSAAGAAGSRRARERARSSTLT
jgi:predicted MFS family arabinose efflux permease